jgi:predicted HAD superfamily Cof-like phosphohydrolase
MITMQGWITELMTMYEQDQPVEPIIPNEDVEKLRISLVQEEMTETINAMKRRDMIEVADGLADVLVVTLGTHNAYGLDSAHDYHGKMPSHAPRFPDAEKMDIMIEGFKAHCNDFPMYLRSREIHEVQAACDEIVELVLDTSLFFGIDILPVFMEVHWSNKTKFGKDGRPIKNEMGKVKKGPDYQKPDIDRVLKLQSKYYIHTK